MYADANPDRQALDVDPDPIRENDADPTGSGSTTLPKTTWVVVK